MALFIIFLQWIIKSIPSENTTDIYFILFFIIIRFNTKYIKIKKRRKKRKEKKKNQHQSNFRKNFTTRNIAIWRNPPRGPLLPNSNKV